MTKKEFKRAMVCGLGRCIQTLDREDDAEKYRDIILWGCTHEIFYDAQCEENKSWYLYELVKHYQDVSPFIEAVIACAQQQMTKESPLFVQCCSFLGYFGLDGNKRAYQALYVIYQDLYQILMHKRKRTKYRLLPESDNFEELCNVIVGMYTTEEDSIHAYCKIVDDLGTLLMNNSLFHAWNFEWFQEHWEEEMGRKRLHNILTKKAKKSEAVHYYIAAMQQRQEERENQGTSRRKTPKTAEDVYDKLVRGGKVGYDIPVLIVRLWTHAGQEQEVKNLAQYHKKEKDAEVRAQLTRILAREQGAYLLDVDVLIADSKSENKLLQEYAFQALSYIRHKKVRAYAFELLGDVEDSANILKRATQLEYFESVFGMLIYNYEKKDENWFVEAVKAIPVLRSEKINWHSIYRDLQRMFKKGKMESLPKEILYHMYEYGQCACCREDIVMEMSRRKMLTEELLQECLYDSNSEIRKFAEKEKS